MSRKSYLKLQSVEIHIASPVPIIRYEVQVLSENQIPVYDSAMNFVTVQNASSSDIYGKNEQTGATTHFLIPDYPANTTSFEYTADGDKAQNIKVAPYQVTLVERNFFFPALDGRLLALEGTP